MSLTFCTLEAVRYFRKKEAGGFKPGFRIGSLTGILCGFTTVVTHAAGVFVNIYLKYMLYRRVENYQRDSAKCYKQRGIQ